jgi:DNA-binding NarL/FixJ family response regulator
MEKPKSKETRMAMTPAERGRSCVLIVESDAGDRNNARTALKALGYGGVSEAPNHFAAVEKLNERKFTHILFEAKKTNMPPKEFLEKVFQGYPNCVCIPTSYQPDVDDVFDLLITGARGYLSKPFTIDSMEDAIVMATKGDPISDAVLNAKDRNEALVSILMSSLDKAATTLRQAEQFETPKHLRRGGRRVFSTP